MRKALPNPVFGVDLETEGVRYSGSKRTVIPIINECISQLDIRSTLDAFTGTTRVAQYFKKRGFDVHANDIAPYSKVLADCYIKASSSSSINVADKIKHLNNLNPEHGYFTQYYGGEDDGFGGIKSYDGKKKPFLVKNTMKLDAIRKEIDVISEGELEKAILITSLINALDKVENTLGHQVAYLSKWANRSYEDLVLREPRLISGNGKYEVSSVDAKTISSKFDLAYLDPPYNTNNMHTPTTRVRYSSYYHFWTTVVKNDRPDVVGASNRRYDCSSDRIPGCVSAYESIKYDIVLKEIQSLISSMNCRYLMLSYSNKGKVNKKDLLDVLSTRGKVDIKEFSYKENVQKKLTTNKKWLGDMSQNIEYLFLVRCKD